MDDEFPKIHGYQKPMKIPEANRDVEFGSLEFCAVESILHRVNQLVLFSIKICENYVLKK